MLPLANAVFLGTLILAIRMPDAIYIGVDSRVVSIGPSIRQVTSQPKIHQNAGVVFAHAGIFKNKAGKLDVVAAINSAIEHQKMLEKVADRSSEEIERQLLSVLPDLEQENPTYFREKILDKRPLELLFASVHNEVPKLIVVMFQFSHHDGEPKITVTRLICPGDCPNDISAIALGEHDAADNYLDTHPEIFHQQGPLMAIRKATEAQATATPDYVSLPVTIWKITSRGITSDQSFDLHAR